MSKKAIHIIRRTFSVVMVMLIINLNLNALYQTSLMNPDSSCHTKTVETSCCEMETEKMSEAECLLSKWIGTHQISSCTCLHDINEQSSVIITTDKSNPKIIERISGYFIDPKRSGKEYISEHNSTYYKYQSAKIYLIDSSLLI